ncbi:MAG: diguanylate cyclase [Atribacterota bacterium]|nr:diguanylate cyclase [Atribacterota bacterium]
MINILPFLHFFAFLVYFYLIAYLLSKNSKSLLNRVCAAFLGCFALWSLMLTFLFIPGTLKETAIFFDNIASIGWISLASFFLWFALIFTKNKKFLQMKIFYLCIFALPVLFIYQQWTGLITVDYIKKSWGWAGIWSCSIWAYLFFAYFITFITIGLYLIYAYKAKTKNLYEQKQAKIILITALIALIVSTVIEVILPELQIIKLPSLGNVVTLIWAAGLVYTIAKYDFMAITPGFVAEKILSAMSDSLLLMDKDGKIFTVNESLEQLTGYKESELKGKTMDLFFPGEKFCQSLLNQSNNNDVIKNLEQNLTTKNNTNVPVVISSSLITGNKGIILGIVCIIKDMTQYIQTLDALRESEKRFQDVTENALEWIWEVDATGKYIYSNHVCEKILGYMPEEVLGKYFYDFFDPEQKRKLKNKSLAMFADKKSFREFLNLNISKGGKPVWLLTSGVPVLDNDSRLLGYRGTDMDISERIKTEKQLKKLARIDSLTGCYNRGYGLELAQRHISLSKRHQSPLLLAFLDIDNFKDINDNHGHLEGDKVLKQAASLFKKNLREIDIISRLGGDEFLLVFPDSSLKDMDSIKKRIYAALSDLNEKIKINANYNIQLSMGFAEYLPDKPKELDELISIADQQMYKEKNNKKQ